MELTEKDLSVRVKLWNKITDNNKGNAHTYTLNRKNKEPPKRWRERGGRGRGRERDRKAKTDNTRHPLMKNGIFFIHAV